MAKLLDEKAAKLEFVCSICQLPFRGYGNNALPINPGRCCDRCDENVVIPARINQMIRIGKKMTQN